MTKHEIEARQKFENLITSESGDHLEGMDGVNARTRARELARLLLRHGKTYARIQEGHCNGVGTWYGESAESFSKRQSRFEDRQEQREKQLESRMRAICAELGIGFEPVFSGDPRGSTVKIKVPSGKTDDWNHEGVCVPSA